MKLDPVGNASKSSFAEFTPQAPSENCITTFAGTALPWPPEPDAEPAQAACGGWRPGLNVAPARWRRTEPCMWLAAPTSMALCVSGGGNRGFEAKWSASLRDQLNDGCGVPLPPNETVGGCRAAGARGVDPATNERPAGTVFDESTASTVVAPDGYILFGEATR